MEQNKNKIPDNKNMKQSDLEKIVMTKSKQFKFDCNVFVARITEDIDSVFGLKYHFHKTSSLDEFIESVREFLKTSIDADLTSSDIKGLERQYNIGIKQKL